MRWLSDPLRLAAVVNGAGLLSAAIDALVFTAFVASLSTGPGVVACVALVMSRGKSSARAASGVGLTVASMVRIRVAPKALKAMKTRVRQLTRRTCGLALSHVAQDLRPYLLGWRTCFRLADTPKKFRELDEWIRHRVRSIQLKQWKQGRTVYRELVSRGASPDLAAAVAANTRRWWKNAALALHRALPNRWCADLGLPQIGV